MLEKIRIFNQDVSMFPIMIGIGCIFGVITFIVLGKKRFEQKEMDNVYCLLPIVIAGGIFSGVLWDKIAHFSEKVWYLPAGISVAGGVLGGFILYCLFYKVIVKKENRNFIGHIEILVPAFIIAQAFGRIGCFCAGCCYGKPSDSIFAVTFPIDSIPYEKMGYVTKILPTQLFESAFLFALFLFIVLFKKHASVIYFISYGVFRFFIEFLRGDNRGAINPIFSPSQILSIIFILIGISFIIMKKKEKQLKNG